NRRYVSPEVAADVRESIEQPWSRPDGYHVQLTPRQHEVLGMLANGVPTSAIATTMGISVKTVEFHKAGIMNKLGIKTIAELTRFALGQGMTEL
ncbi:MAG: LuxR C-terminal-related transcriptional regulator, partial [Nitrospiraceae bacterium]